MRTNTAIGVATVTVASILPISSGCSLQDFDLDGDGQVTRAEVLFGAFEWLSQEVTADDGSGSGSGGSGGTGGDTGGTGGTGGDTGGTGGGTGGDTGGTGG